MRVLREKAWDRVSPRGVLVIIIMLGKRKTVGEKKSMETCHLCQDSSYMFLPFDPLIALLGTCPKETTGNLGEKT